MEKHVKILGILLIVSGVLDIIGASIGYSVFAGSRMLYRAYSYTHCLHYVYGWFGLMMIGLIMLYAVPAIIAGWGVLNRWSWARIFGMIVCIIHLTSLPLGTALGIYGLWVLFSDETVKIFSGAGPQTA